jgi:hypothetical protein
VGSEMCIRDSCRTWNMVRKLTNEENEKLTL